MPIRFDYTPYGAVGKLAEAAGKAQQAVREQQYQFTATQQARSIAANLQAQRERIGAEMQMQDERLEQQNIQFGEEMELRNAQVQAQEAAAGFQYLNQRRSLQQQADQFEQQMAAKEKAFEITTAMDDRRLQIAEQTSDLAVDRFLADQELRQSNMELWQNLEGTIDPDIYTNGVLAVQAGRLPQLPDPQQAKLMTEAQKQRFDLTQKQMYIKQKTYEQKIAQIPLKDDEREMFAAIAERVTPSRGRLLPFRIEKEHIDDATTAYEQYTNAVNYGALGENQKTEADAIFEQTMVDHGIDTAPAKLYLEKIRNSHWRYVPVSQRAETYLQTGGQAQAATTAPTQAEFTYVKSLPKGEGESIVGRDDIIKLYMTAARGDGSVARKLARDNGWTGF